MRPLESYILVLTFATLWHGTLPLVLTRIAAYLLLLVTAVHCSLEHPRWQLTLTYLQVAHLLYSVLLSSDAKWPCGWTFFLCSCALLMATAALASIFPVATFPALTGRFQAVGVAHRYIPTNFVAKPTHSQAGASQPITRNEFIGVNVFYPSSTVASKAVGAQFLTSGVASALGSFLSMPAMIFSFLSLGRTRAVPDLPVVAADSAAESNGNAAANGSGGSANGSSSGAAVPTKLPVILLSHGLGGVSSMYTIQATELASQGYVVLAPTHTDGSACLAELPDGKTIPYSRMPTVGSPERQAQLKTRANELSYLIDVIEQAEQDGGAGWPVDAPFRGRLDTERIGLVGHSFGGATVAVCAAQDERVKSVVAHDLWAAPVAPTLLSKGLQQPLLVTFSEEWAGWREIPAQVQQLVRASAADGHIVSLAGLKHSNYSDVPLFSQMISRKIGAIGAVDFTEGLALVNRTQVAFLDATLIKGVRTDKAIFEADIKSKAMKVLYDSKVRA